MVDDPFGRLAPVRLSVCTPVKSKTIEKNSAPHFARFGKNSGFFAWTRTLNTAEFYCSRLKSFPSHMAHGAALIIILVALSQTPVYTARPQIQG